MGRQAGKRQKRQTEREQRVAAREYSRHGRQGRQAKCSGEGKEEPHNRGVNQGNKGMGGKGAI